MNAMVVPKKPLTPEVIEHIQRALLECVLPFNRIIGNVYLRHIPKIMYYPGSKETVVEYPAHVIKEISKIEEERNQVVKILMDAYREIYDFTVERGIK